jgi:hypothetical protein
MPINTFLDFDQAGRFDSSKDEANNVASYVWFGSIVHTVRTRGMAPARAHARASHSMFCYL